MPFYDIFRTKTTSSHGAPTVEHVAPRAEAPAPLGHPGDHIAGGDPAARAMTVPPAPGRAPSVGSLHELFALEKVSGDEKVMAADSRAKAQGDEARALEKSHKEKTKELASLKVRLSELDSAPKEFGDSHSAFKGNIEALRKFYRARTMSEKAKAAERDAINARLSLLASGNSVLGTNGTPLDAAQIAAEKTFQERNLVALAADPLTVKESFESGTLERAASAVAQRFGFSTATVENPIEKADSKLANARFGLMLDNQATWERLHNELERGLQYDPSKADLADSTLYESLLTLQSAIGERLDLDFKSGDKNDEALFAEMRLIGSLVNAKTELDGTAALRNNFIERNKPIQSLSTEVGNLDRQKSKAAQTRNLRDYQALAARLTSASDNIRDLTKQKKELGATLEARKAELATAPDETAKANLTTEIEQLNARLERNGLNLAAFEAAFKAAMLGLESFETELAKRPGSESQYPSDGMIEGVKQWLLNTVSTSPDYMPTKEELMRQFHLAKNGLDGVSGAYWESAKSLANSLSAGGLVSGLKLNDPAKLLEQIREFAMQNPVLARELGANLLHTYKILSADPSSGITADLYNSAMNTLDRKTIENVISDMTLGEREHLYSAGELKALSPEQIAFFDLAQKAPYLAAIVMGARETGIAAKTATALASLVGAGPITKAITGSAAAIGQVKAEKELAKQISRNQEIMANSLRIGFNALSSGGSPADAAIKVASFAAARKGIQMTGTLARDIREQGSMRKVLASRLREIRDNLRDNPFAELGKLATAGVAGTAVGVAAGSAVLTATTVAAAPLAVAIGTAILAAIAGRLIIGVGADILNPAAAKERKLKATTNRLQRASEKLSVKYSSNLPSDVDKNLLGQAFAQGLKSLSQEGDYTKAAKLTKPETQEEYLLKKLDSYYQENITKLESQANTDAARAKKTNQLEAAAKASKEMTGKAVVDTELAGLQNTLAQIAEKPDGTRIEQLRNELKALGNDSAVQETLLRLEEYKNGNYKIEDLKDDLATLRLRQFEAAELRGAEYRAQAEARKIAAAA